MSLTDKNGHPFEVRNLRYEDFSLLAAMYDDFSPKGKFQGLPPKDRDARNDWIKRLLKNGENYMAWREGKVIGHAVILPDSWTFDAEYLIFVNQSYRGLGVGTALTRTALEKAEEIGLKILWLTLDAYNIRATRLYKKCGFDFFISYKSISERMMLYCCRKNLYA